MSLLKLKYQVQKSNVSLNKLKRNKSLGTLAIVLASRVICTRLEEIDNQLKSYGFKISMKAISNERLIYRVVPIA